MKYTCALLFLAAASTAQAASRPLMDASSGQLLTIPSDAPGSNLVALVSSPDTPNGLLPSEQHDQESILSLTDQQILHCRGATLGGTSTADRLALCTTGATASAIALDGITTGDVQDFLNSRHARTLTALMRGALAAATSSSQSRSDTKTLVLVVPEESTSNPDTVQSLQKQVEALYEAVRAEQPEADSFDKVYSVQVMGKEEAQQFLTKSAAEASTETSLATALADDFIAVRPVASQGLDTPTIAAAFLAVQAATTKASLSLLAQEQKFKARTARGLLVDDFGALATRLLQSILPVWDATTRATAGVAVVGPIRQEQRSKLRERVRSVIQNAYAAQLVNLEAAAVARLQKRLLRLQASGSSNDGSSKADAQAALLRQESLNVETILDNLDVPALGLTKEKALPNLSAALQAAVLSFSDSPLAKLQRTAQVTKTVNKEKKPTERSVQFGLDLVAMLRPDGFGSLQGYAGYQLGGNSITFGIHNDADDPQTIAQFGGVRPPLLRVQPKLRVEVEM